MFETGIDEEVESYFAASPIGPLLELCRVAREEDHPLFYGIKKSFELVQSDVLAQVFADDNFCGLYDKVSQEEKEWFAREWIIIEELNRRIRPIGSPAHCWQEGCKTERG